MTRTPLALLLALAGSTLPAGARAQDAADPGVTDAVSAGLEVDVPSRYVARGVAASEGPTLQPSAWVGYAGLSALVWTSFDPLGQPEVGNRPTDLTAGLAYGAEFGPFTAEPSATVVTFPGLPEGATTVELGLEAALSLGPIAACTTQSLDAVAFRGAYCAKAGACAAHDFGAGVALEGDVGAGGGNRAFNEANFGVAAWGLDHVEANVAITIPADSLYLRAHGTVSRLVHPDLVRALPEPLVGFAGLAVGAEI
jgi:hypothetical protein